ncbi:MAG: BolA family protein [Rhodospirillaceae bacterium]
MTVTDSIRVKLTAALTPTRLEINDDSARHHGHAGAHPEGESHFSVTVVAAAFEGLPTVARHRLVYSALADELSSRVHALQLKTLTPSQDS